MWQKGEERAESHSQRSVVVNSCLHLRLHELFCGLREIPAAKKELKGRETAFSSSATRLNEANEQEAFVPAWQFVSVGYPEDQEVGLVGDTGPEGLVLVNLGEALLHIIVGEDGAEALEELVHSGSCQIEFDETPGLPQRRGGSYANGYIVFHFLLAQVHSCWLDSISAPLDPGLQLVRRNVVIEMTTEVPVELCC